MYDFIEIGMSLTCIKEDYIIGVGECGQVGKGYEVISVSGCSYKL